MLAGAPVLAVPSAASAPPTLGFFDISQFGAVGDGVALNTGAIQKAIDSCAASGGGTVIIPNGRYVTGTLFLKTNVTLWLDGGASLLGSPKIDDYAPGTHRNMYARETHMDRCLILPVMRQTSASKERGSLMGRAQIF